MFCSYNFNGKVMDKRPLELAERIIRIVSSIGEEAFKAYALSHLKMEEFPDFICDDFIVEHTSCDLGLKYILTWLNEDYIIENCYLDDSITDKYIEVHLENLDKFSFTELIGLYYVQIVGAQPHAFTLLIKQDTVLYFGTYAGHRLIRL